MTPSIQHSPVFDASSSLPIEDEAAFEWNEEATAIFKSACLALIYLNGGKVELSKERFCKNRPQSTLSPKRIQHILAKGEFPVFKTLGKRTIEYHVRQLEKRGGETGATWEEELLEQYRNLERMIIPNAEGKEIPALWQELNKFGVKPEEYDQGLSIENCFEWDKEKEAIFTSACFALIYLNGGRVDLSEERVRRGNQKNALAATAVEYILQKGDVPLCKTFSKGVLNSHLICLRAKSKKRGSTWEEEILKQYQELERTTIFNAEGKEIPALWQELDKFGIKPEEYDQWLPLDTFFIWDKEREAIFKSACVALIYLNGGKLELSKERIVHRRVKTALSTQSIEYLLKKGNFPALKNLPKHAVEYRLRGLKKKSSKMGSTWGEEMLKHYQVLQITNAVNAEGREVPALLLELEKFGIDPAEYDNWILLRQDASSNKQNPRKRLAEKPADPDEPEKKRPNKVDENPPQGNRVTHWKKRLINDWNHKLV